MSEEKRLWKPLDIYKIASEIYGPERVFLDLLGSSWDEDNPQSTSYHLVIHFPTIEIRNSKKHKHTITDMYIRVVVGNIYPESIGNYRASIGIQGRRGTMSLKEWNSGYGQSHCSGGINNWGYFCLGASDFNTTISDLRLSLSEDTWYIFLFSIEKYLEWESLEGGPYYRIANLSYQGTVNQFNPLTMIGTFIKDIPLEVFEFSGELKLIKNHPALYKFYDSKSPVKQLNTYDLTRAQQDVDQANRGTGTFIFNDKPVKLTVKIPDDILPSGFIEPEIINRYNQTIENKLNEFNGNLAFEQLKLQNKDRVFGKTGSLQQA